MARLCRECGCELKPLGLKPQAAFCGPAHRKQYNNRRMIRGAELYDLMMSNRFQREDAKNLNLLSVMSNLTRAYRDADKAARNGRRSWNLQEALARLPSAYGREGDKR